MAILEDAPNQNRPDQNRVPAPDDSAGSGAGSKSAQSDHPPQAEGGPEAPEVVRIVLPIDGMTCASCVSRVEKALNKAPGVSQVRVNLASEQAEVLFDPAQSDPEHIAGAVRKAGSAFPTGSSIC